MDLPLCDGHNTIFTCIDRLTNHCRLIPCFVREGALSASLIAKIFFNNVVKIFGLPEKVILDRDTRFTAFFC